MMYTGVSLTFAHTTSASLYTNLNEFTLDGFCPLQLCLYHLDELRRPILCLNIAETGFLNKLQSERQKETDVTTYRHIEQDLYFSAQKFKTKTHCKFLHS